MAEAKPNGGDDLRALLREVLRDELKDIRLELAFLRTGHDTLRSGIEHLRALTELKFERTEQRLARLDRRLELLKAELLEEIEAVVKLEVGGTRTPLEARLDALEAKVAELAAALARR